MTRAAVASGVIEVVQNEPIKPEVYLIIGSSVFLAATFFKQFYKLQAVFQLLEVA